VLWFHLVGFSITFDRKIQREDLVPIWPSNVPRTGSELGIGFWVQFDFNDQYINVAYLVPLSVVVAFEERLQVYADRWATERATQWEQIVTRHAASRLAAELSSSEGSFPGPQVVRVLSLDDVPGLVRLYDKTCSYQSTQGRDLFCTARRGEAARVTSRPLCRICPMPSDETLCSHLRHPLVALTHSPDGQVGGSFLAICDIARSEVSAPSGCRLGGHVCGIVRGELRVDSRSTGVTPEILPDLLDFLDATWRLRFGSRLFRLRGFANVSSLARPCVSRGDLVAAVSSMDDLLKSMTIADNLIPPEQLKEENLKGDKTLNRLEAAIKSQLPAERLADGMGAVECFRKINRVRVAFQHSGRGGELESALQTLGVEDLADYSEAWRRIRVAVANAALSLKTAINQEESA
jgi:hypothetical protein